MPVERSQAQIWKNCEKKVDENIKIWYHINTDKEEYGLSSD